MSGDTARLLGADINHPTFNGTALRVERELNRLKSDKGFLVLKGEKRLWLFSLSVKNSQVYTTIQPFTAELFNAEISKLVA